MRHRCYNARGICLAVLDCVCIACSRLDGTLTWRLNAILCCIHKGQEAQLEEVLAHMVLRAHRRPPPCSDTRLAASGGYYASSLWVSISILLTGCSSLLVQAKQRVGEVKQRTLERCNHLQVQKVYCTSFYCNERNRAHGRAFLLGIFQDGAYQSSTCVTTIPKLAYASI